METIGTYHLEQDKVFTAGGEYAGHNWSTEVPAGEYPVELHRNQYGERYVLIRLHGLRRESFFNRIGAHGSLKRYEPVMADHTLQPYAHTIYGMVDSGLVTMADGWETRPIHYEYNGKPGTTHGIFQNGERVRAR